jgi:hypothetical protein
MAPNCTFDAAAATLKPLQDHAKQSQGKHATAVLFETILRRFEEVINLKNCHAGQVLSPQQRGAVAISHHAMLVLTLTTASIG